ncbi:MAG: CarD family transcriptional regulator [Clostridia bacterium]|nr:CarD family transcriptional regulator [Clostridia bacterium]MBR0438025.1 CarD family transcriptional regulator [Clostridia bacterium]
MFDVGTYVMYNRTGVCQVMNIGSNSMPDVFENDDLFYTLKAVYGTEIIYLPVDSDKLREIVNKEAAELFLKKTPSLIEQFREEDPKVEQRELSNFYKSLLANSDMEDWLKLLSYIYRKKEVMRNGGKKLCQTDKIYEDKVEQLMFGELSIALDRDRDEVRSRFIERFLS